MADNLGQRLRNAWNTFTNNDPARQSRTPIYSEVQGVRKSPGFRSTDGTTLASIRTTIAVEASRFAIRHGRVDDRGRLKETLSSGLDNCFTREANVDQAARAFKRDVFASLLEHGVIAILPVDTTASPNLTDAYDVLTMRVGRVLEWFSDSVRVEAYDSNAGRVREVVVRKSDVALVESPMIEVMNSPNSTFQRLLRKLALLDASDETLASGKLDIIIQLPYSVRSEARKAEAEKRRKNLEEQLSGSKYGIAYADATEKITQLNRPAENNLQLQVSYLTTKLYNELGLSESIISGEADETAMANFERRTLFPLIEAVTEEITRKFISKTAYAQGQRVVTIRDPFRNIPVSQIPDIGDKLIRNKILTANEIREILGFPQDDSKEADELHNPNMPADKEAGANTDERSKWQTTNSNTTSPGGLPRGTSAAPTTE